ncbi:hypothetical protein T492DRAFT_1088656 [Pavlovales sp. CCMP2436]|nr:hypothetical protein T492DRAFT_1088656 [Pavlovales sp. CCMP2436]
MLLRQVRIAYPLGLRDGVLLALVHFSKHSGRQGFIKHMAQLLFSGLITKVDYLALCAHDTLAVNMIHYVLGSRDSGAARAMVGYPPQPHMPHALQILSVQRAMVGQFTAMRQEQALQMATFAQVMVSVLSTSLMGLAQSGAPVPAEQLHAVAASLNAVGNTLVASCAQLNATHAMMWNHPSAPPVMPTCPHLEGAPFSGVLPQVLPPGRWQQWVPPSSSTWLPQQQQQQQQPWGLPQPQPQQQQQQPQNYFAQSQQPQQVIAYPRAIPLSLPSIALRSLPPFPLPLPYQQQRAPPHHQQPPPLPQPLQAPLPAAALSYPVRRYVGGIEIKCTQVL